MLGVRRADVFIVFLLTIFVSRITNKAAAAFAIPIVIPEAKVNLLARLNIN